MRWLISIGIYCDDRLYLGGHVRSGLGRFLVFGSATMNTQNIPRDDKTVKKAFVPKLDCFFLADYPNIELKLLAFYLEQIGHPSMAEFFREDEEGDLHKRTAAGMYGKTIAEVTDAERQIGKRLNFSIVYGGGSKTLIKQGAAKDFKEACEILYRFHAAWPGIGWDSPIKKHYGESIKAAHGTLTWLIGSTAKERGYITTLWGRHLHPKAEHSALNALIQGCAADLMKWALIEVDDWTKAEGLQSHLINVVHDELMMDAVTYELPELADCVPNLMTYQPVQEFVPIKPSPDVSWTTWADKEAYEVL